MVKEVLSRYELASGQKINLQKLVVRFIPNLEEVNRNSILGCLGLSTSISHDAYHRLPSFLGRNKKRGLGDLRERVWKKLQTWKGKLFSIGRSEILIKAVAQATSTNAMSVFKIPSTLCDDLHSLISRFWWGGDAKERKIHWLRRDKLCHLKQPVSWAFGIYWLLIELRWRNKGGRF